jgi:hypothetical protein
MATVTVPSDFFRGELRVYGDWREAFARELLQNAVDARPSRIDVEFGTVDGHGRVVFTDDGQGMSRRVLEDVFFALGKTTKSGPDTVGGFGRARIIICFAQTRYQIRTGNLLVEGAGGEYTITEVAEHQPGCRFVIDLLDSDSDRVRYAFTELLGTCTLQVPVYVDSRRVWPRSMPARATRMLRDEHGNAWARIYVSNNRRGTMCVRVHGLTMFEQWLSGGDEIILELTPSRSREVLSASRDQLRGEYKQQVDKFVSDLTRNRRAALRPADQPLNRQVTGGGFLRTDSYTQPMSAPDAATATTTGAEPALAGAGAGTAAAGRGHGGQLTDGSQVVAVTPANLAALANQALATPTPGFAAAAARLPQPTSALGFDVFLFSDCSDTRVRRLARLWDPSNWGITTGRRRRAVLLAWKRAVEIGLDQLVRLHPELTSVLWTVGWTFDAETDAEHRGTGGGHVLALNPVTKDGRTAYQLSERMSRQRLLALALHEVAHVAVDGHDERFAKLLTELVAAVDPTEADRALRTAAAGA